MQIELSDEATRLVTDELRAHGIPRTPEAAGAFVSGRLITYGPARRAALADLLDALGDLAAARARVSRGQEEDALQRVLDAYAAYETVP